VESPQEGEFLVINELQLRYQTEMPRRVRAYSALAVDVNIVFTQPSFYYPQLQHCTLMGLIICNSKAVLT
jgi:hypothetical protein